MAEEEAGEVEKKDSGGPGRYFVLVLLILLLEGGVGYWLLDRAVPAPEVAEEVIEAEEDEVVVWKAPIYYEAMENLRIDKG